MVTHHRTHRDLSSIAIEALAEYFRPIMYFIGLFEKSISFDAERKNLLVRQQNTIAVLRAVQKAVCFNQGAYIQYAFVTAEKHRKLKDKYKSDQRNASEISLLAKDLVDFINEKFYDNSFENFKLLHAYFNARSGSSPRICIKGNFRSNDQDTVVSVFRDQRVSYNSNADIHSNYGFYNIYKTGTYFLENNIPKAAASGHYYNPRLNNSYVKEYLSGRKGREVTSWSDCWIDGCKDPQSCYRSTLIIPMTLWNNKVSEEFKDLINLENVDRTIFGFLCFDHTDENYFDEEHDVAVGYVFADMMSLYVFTRLVYMEISKTFKSVESWLKSNDADLAVKPLASLWKDIPSDIDMANLLKFKPVKSTNNDLFQLDHDLLKFINTLSTISNNKNNTRPNG